MTSPSSHRTPPKEASVITSTRSFESILDSHAYIFETLQAELRVYRLMHMGLGVCALLCIAAIVGVMAFFGG